MAALGAALIAVVQCRKQVDEDFLINKEQVGKLRRGSKAGDIATLFSGDSVVVDSAAGRFGGSSSRINVFEKGGKPLLLLSTASDSTEIIENVRVLDTRYSTAEGVGLNSTFKDIQQHYPIKKIVTSLNNIVVFVKGQDFYFTISRDQLPASLRYSADLQVEQVQIPDQARIKYLMVGWQP